MRTTVAVLLATLIIPTGASAALPQYTALPVPLPVLPPAFHSVTSVIALSDTGLVLFYHDQLRVENSNLNWYSGYSLANPSKNTVVEVFPLSVPSPPPYPITFTSGNTLLFTGDPLLFYSNGQFTPVPSPSPTNTIFDIRSANRRSDIVGENLSRGLL